MNKGNKVKKLNRPKDQRTSLLRNLAKSLIISEKIVTTQARGKAVSGYFDKLMTIAKKDNESSRRQLFSELGSERLVAKLVDIIAKNATEKSSGYCSRFLLEKRSGDNAQKMRVEINTQTKAPVKAKTKTEKKSVK